MRFYAEASLAIVHFISLPLFVGEWLNSLIFHDNIKCIAASGQTVVYVSACKMSRDNYAFHTKNV